MSDKGSPYGCLDHRTAARRGLEADAARVRVTENAKGVEVIVVFDLSSSSQYVTRPQMKRFSPAKFLHLAHLEEIVETGRLLDRVLSFHGYEGGVKQGHP